MDQRRIKNLLEEAARPDCLEERRDEIQRMLIDNTSDDTGMGAGHLIILENLFEETIKNRLELLPTFFPVFVLMCGDRVDEITAEIDWSLV